MKVGAIIALLAEAGEEWKIVRDRQPSAAAGSKPDDRSALAINDHGNPAEAHHPTSRKPTYLFFYRMFPIQIYIKY